MALQVSVGLIGPGLVGGALLEQLVAHHAKLGDNALVRVAGVINSKNMLLMEKPPIPTITMPTCMTLSQVLRYQSDQCEKYLYEPIGRVFSDTWPSKISMWGHGQCEKANMEAFIAHLGAQAPTAIIIDCTSSESVAAYYSAWLSRGLHVVTPNKKAFSGDLSLYKELLTITATKKALLYHEATVGAGLPIISTLKGLVRTGDEVVRIEGIFSGTMSFLFNTFSSPLGPSKMPFSACVKIAKEKGFTEPDPRDDLNGMDVARKVVILGRVSGLDLTLNTLKIQDVVPTELQSVKTSDEFMARLPEFDDYFAKMNSAAAAKKEVLRYVGVVNGHGESAAELRSYPYSHPFANLQGSDNIISFTTTRYPNPLIVQGAGAGAAVTAAGIFSDVLTIADRVL